MRSIIVGVVMFGLGWGFTAILAASLEEYQTLPHRPDGAWVSEQVRPNPFFQRVDFGTQSKARSRDGHVKRLAGEPAPAAEIDPTCGNSASPMGGAC